MTHAQPCFTKNLLNMFPFVAKYEGAVSTKCDCVTSLYGADLAVGSSRAKMDPTTRVVGYTASRMISSDVGRNGDLLDVNFVFVGVPFALLVLGVAGVDGEGDSS